MRMQSNIASRQNVAAVKQLCVGCGTCVASCPQQHITLKYDEATGLIMPDIGAGCINCGLCLENCPSIYPVLPDSSIQDFRGLRQWQIGKIDQAYVGYAVDDEIRRQGQSGGIVSAILHYLLANDLIDGAIAATNAPDPFAPRGMVIRTPAEISQTAGSKYCPIPVNADLASYPDGRYAYVGLPCQMTGLINFTRKHSKINKMIPFRIGLICDRILNYRFINYLMTKFAIQEGQKIEFFYRSKQIDGWPGHLLFRTEGKDWVIDKKYRILLKDYFTAPRCLLCYDKLNLQAGIVCGDAWGLAQDDKAGRSIVLTRNRMWEEIVRSMQEQGYCRLQDADLQRVIRHQAPERKLAVLCAGRTLLDPGMVINYGHVEKVLASFNSLSLRLAARLGRKHLSYPLTPRGFKRLCMARLGRIKLEIRLKNYLLKAGLKYLNRH